MELALLGLSLGIAAGATPGPLLALTVEASLERGFGAGARFAVAPILSDLPVLVASLLLLSEIPERFLALVSGAGGVFVIVLGAQTLRKTAGGAAMSFGKDVGAVDDLRKAVLVNVLNPNPWLFWAAVGGPILLEGWRRQPASGAAFLGTFYLMLVGSKLVIAGVVARGRHRLSEPWYRRLVGFCGVLLLLLGAGLVVRSALLWSGS